MRPTIDSVLAGLVADKGISLSEALLSALDTHDRGARVEAIARAARTAEPEALVAIVGDGENSIARNAAMQALADGGERSVPALVKALRSPDADVVLFSLGVLGRTRDRSAIPHIIPLLEDDNLNVAQAAIEALANLRASVAVDALVRTLRRDPWLQFAAIQALGEIGDARSVQALAPLLSEEGLREVVVEALGRIGTREALGVLAKLLRDTLDSDGFLDCLRALGDLLDQQPDDGSLGSVTAWAELGSAGAADVQDRLARILATPVAQGTRGQEEIDLKRAAATIVRALMLRSLYVHLIRAGENERLRERLRFCAVAIGAEIGPMIVAALKDANPNVRAFACECAGTLALHAATPSLLTLLADAAANVRASATLALSRLQYLAVIPTLVALLDDASPSVADAAEEALSRFDPELVARAIPSNVARGDSLVRVLAIAAKCPHVSQRSLVLASLEDPRANVRRAAALALGAHRVPDCESIVEPLLADSSSLVRFAAYEVLGQSRTARSRDLLLGQLQKSRGSEASSHIVAALAEHDAPTIAPYLTRFLSKAPPGLRITIAQALVRLDRVAAEPVLVRLLADPAPKVRACVVRALSSLPSPTILGYLISAARDVSPEVRAAVAETLPFASNEQPDNAPRVALERLSVDADAIVSRMARERLQRLSSRDTFDPLGARETVRPHTRAMLSLSAPAAEEPETLEHRAGAFSKATLRPRHRSGEGCE
jgi:HEAT repeat protein